MADVTVESPRTPPIDTDVLMHAGAMGSVGPDRLPASLLRAQGYLETELDAYRREFECVHEAGGRACFLVPEDHWSAISDDVPLGSREVDAVRRAHEQQLRRIGSETGRREEFESALEIRSAVVVATGEGADETGGEPMGETGSEGTDEAGGDPAADADGSE